MTDWYENLMELELLSAYVNDENIEIFLKEECSEDGLCKPVEKLNILVNNMDANYFSYLIKNNSEGKMGGARYSDLMKVVFNKDLNIPTILLKSYVAMRDKKKMFLRVSEKARKKLVVEGNFNVVTIYKDSIDFTDDNAYFSLQLGLVPKYEILSILRVKSDDKDYSAPKTFLDCFNNKV